MHDWDDWRCVLALARVRKAAKAAEALDMDVSTLKRRVKNLNDRLGVQILFQQGHSYLPTEAGETILEAAERMSDEVLKVENSLGMARPLIGALRIMMPEDLAADFFNVRIMEFCEKFPSVELDLIIDSRNLSLSHYEADVAVQTVPLRADAFEEGEKICAVAWSCYVSERYKAQNSWPEDPQDLWKHTIIAPSDRPHVGRWLKKIRPVVQTRVRSTSLLTILHMALNGMGIAILPCYLGDTEKSLSRLFDPIEALSENLWIVSHKNVFRTARVQAFFDTVGKLGPDERHRIEGRPPPRVRARA